jgi:phosphate uptake regulator
MTTDGSDDPIERKVQMTGGSTYTISLPKGWATARGIETGTPLYLYASDDRIVAAREPDDDADGRAVSIDADEVETAALGDTLTTAYVAGYDEIVLKRRTEFDAAQRRAVRSAVTGLVGVEIHSQRPTEITIRSLLDGGEVSLRQTIAQMRMTALTMHEDAVRAVAEDDADLARQVVQQDDDVDRLFGLVSRQFHRGLTDFREVAQFEGDRTAAFAHYRTARQLERIADHAETIATVAERQSGEPPAELATELTDLGERAREVVRTAIDEQMESPSIAGLRAVDAQRDALLSDVREVDRRLYDRDVAEPYLFATVLRSVERTAEYGANVVEMGLQSALRGQDAECEDDGDAFSD